MRKKTISNLLIGGLLVYLAFEIGKKTGKKEETVKKPVIIENEDDEETYVTQLINELKNKSDKTKKDKYNIELLEIKLQQIKRDKK